MACAHAPCHCTEAEVERGGTHYCSDACANAPNKAGGTCPCQHAGCAATTR